MKYGLEGNALAQQIAAERFLRGSIGFGHFFHILPRTVYLTFKP